MCGFGFAFLLHSSGSGGGFLYHDFYEHENTYYRAHNHISLLYLPICTCYAGVVWIIPGFVNLVAPSPEFNDAL